MFAAAPATYPAINTPKPNTDGSCATHTVIADDVCFGIAEKCYIKPAYIETLNNQTWGWTDCGMNITNNDKGPASFGHIAYFETWNKKRECLHMSLSGIDTAKPSTHASASSLPTSRPTFPASPQACSNRAPTTSASSRPSSGGSRAPARRCRSRVWYRCTDQAG